MPKVDQYQPNQVQTRVVSQPRAHADAPSAAFGAPVAQGISNLGGALAQTKQRMDTTAAEEALTAFERQKNQLLFNPEDGYFNTQGKNAFDNAPLATKTLEELKRSSGEALSPNARQLFDQSADRHITKAQVDISRHASRGMQAWEVATLESQVENTVENATLYWDQPDTLKVQNVLGRQALLDAAEMQGITGEALNERLQTYDSQFHRATISAATDHGAAEGQAALELYGDRLEGPDKVKLEKKISAKMATERTKFEADFAVTTASALVNRYDSRQDIIDQVNQIEDASLRKRTLDESMRQFRFRQEAESEARAESFENAESHIINGGTAETFKAQDPAGWERMSPKQKQSISRGEAVVTDWNTYSDLMTLPREQLAKVDPTDHYDELAPSERRTLVSAVKSAKGTGTSSDRIDHQAGRTRTAQTTAALEQLLGKKSKWNDDKRKQANSFYSLLDEEVAFREREKGSKLTSSEYTDVLSGLTREVVLEKDWWPDQTLEITDVPTEDVPALSQFLRDNGVPVTADNLLKAYRQASQ